MTQILYYLIIAPPIFLALTFHEFAHAFVANRLGDPTAKQMGRLSLNPLVHLDLLGTAMLFIANIGWAKPVPVNPIAFRNPKRDLLWVSLAGPGSNLLLAFIFGLACRALGIESLQNTGVGVAGIINFLIGYTVVINIVLAIFNILPIPPLDGSKILMGIVPEKYEEQFAPLMRYGPTVLIALIAVGFIAKVPILWKIIDPFVTFFSYIFAGANLML